MGEERSYGRVFDGDPQDGGVASPPRLTPLPARVWPLMAGYTRGQRPSELGWALEHRRLTGPFLHMSRFISSPESELYLSPLLLRG